MNFKRTLVEAERDLLAHFVISEGELAIAIDDVADNDESQKHAKNRSKWQKIKEWVKGNKELLVGKLNDVGKASLGLVTGPLESSME